MNYAISLTIPVVLVLSAILLQPEPDHIRIDSVSIVRQTGASPINVSKYEKVELIVRLSHVAATRFFDPDPARGGLDLSANFIDPTGKRWPVNGFFDGHDWRIRFAPMSVGAWAYSVAVRDASGSATSTRGNFNCVPSEIQGFIQISGRSLRFTSGALFFGVGHNNGWQYDVEQPSFDSMVSQGENLLSFWICTPWIRGFDPTPRAPIENIDQGIGVYNQATCAYIDSVVAHAETSGIYLLPSIWPHDCLCDSTIGPPGAQSSWANNAYSTVCAAADFYQTNSNGGDSPQWTYQKNFYRYLIARWGYSRAIAGWVGVVETDQTTGSYSNAPQVAPWCQAVANYFAANDLFRTNQTGQYPIAFSRLDDPTFNPLSNGLRTTDSYEALNSNTNISTTIADSTQTMRPTAKPVFHAEFGGDIKFGATQPAHLHNGIWAGLSNGAALTPLLWCDNGDFPLLTDPNLGSAMRNQLQYLSEFVCGIDYMGMDGVAPLNLNAGNLNSWGLGLNDRGFGWIQNTSGTIGAQAYTISGVSNGDYTFTWFDPWTSGSTAIQSTTTTAKSGKLNVTLPALAQPDIAYKFILNTAMPINPNPPAASSTALPLTILRMHAVVSPARGTVYVKGSLTAPSAVNWSGTKVDASLLGITRSFTMDSHGRCNSEHGRLVVVANNADAKQISFALSIWKADFATAGLVGTVPTKLSLKFGGQSYEGTASVSTHQHTRTITLDFR